MMDVSTHAELQAELSSFFDSFVEAFNSFSGARIANLYHVPGIARRADGSIQVLNSRAEIDRFFQTTVEGYRRDGCRSCRYKELQAAQMGKRAALGTVTWELLREDVSVLREWRQSYNLLQTDNGWRIFASTYHTP